jgi:hypothetical protein
MKKVNEKKKKCVKRVSIFYTLYDVILRIARNLLETRENIKIESHPFYHVICDRFSVGSSKKNSKMAVFQNVRFSKSPILKIFWIGP